MKALRKLFAFFAVSFYLLTPGAIAFAAPAPVPTCQLTVNNSTPAVGGSITLKWVSTNADSGAITNVGNVGPSGQINLLPSSAAHTTYIGSFTGTGGTANCSVTITINYASTGASGGTQTATLQTNANGVQNATLGSTAPNTPTSVVTSAPLAPISTAPAASTAGLVNCGFGAFNPGASATDDTGSTGCQACDLASLIQSIINFIIGLSIPIAAALFAYAGVLFFTASDDHHKIDQAKAIFKNAFIGFVIIITAWLVVNTVLHAILNQGAYSNNSWFTIQCASNARPVNTNLGTILTTLLGTVPVAVPQSSFVLSNGNIVPTGPQQAQSNGFITDAKGNIVPTYTDSIAAAATSYTGTGTSAGPDGGNLACAWAVNNVLQSAGISPVDGDSVQTMENTLQGGRGIPVNQSDAQAGDIVIQGDDRHVGICQNAGCTSVISNSSSNASFTYVSNVNFSSSYPNGTPSRIYRVTQ